MYIQNRYVIIAIARGYVSMWLLANALGQFQNPQKGYRVYTVRQTQNERETKLYETTVSVTQRTCIIRMSFIDYIRYCGCIYEKAIDWTHDSKANIHVVKLTWTMRSNLTEHALIYKARNTRTNHTNEAFRFISNILTIIIQILLNNFKYKYY